MNAQEMFEEIGCKLCTEFYNGETGEPIIMVVTCKGTVLVRIYMKSKAYDGGFDKDISLKVHLALHQQMKELGWIFCER